MLQIVIYGIRLIGRLQNVSVLGLVNHSCRRASSAEGLSSIFSFKSNLTKC